MQDARETLQLASNYMIELGNRGEELIRIDLSDHKVQEFINEFFPISEDLSDCQRKNNLRLQEELKTRYYNAPDLEWVGKNVWRFINAVSDFSTIMKDLVEYDFILAESIMKERMQSA